MYINILFYMKNSFFYKLTNIGNVDDISISESLKDKLE